MTSLYGHYLSGISENKKWIGLSPLQKLSKDPRSLFNHSQMSCTPNINSFPNTKLKWMKLKIIHDHSFSQLIFTRCQLWAWHRIRNDEQDQQECCHHRAQSALLLQMAPSASGHGKLTEQRENSMKCTDHPPMEGRPSIMFVFSGQSIKLEWPCIQPQCGF